MSDAGATACLSNGAGTEVQNATGVFAPVEVVLSSECRLRVRGSKEELDMASPRLMSAATLPNAELQEEAVHPAHPPPLAKTDESSPRSVSSKRDEEKNPETLQNAAPAASAQAVAQMQAPAVSDAAGAAVATTTAGSSTLPHFDTVVRPNPQLQNEQEEEHMESAVAPPFQQVATQLQAEQSALPSCPLQFTSTVTLRKPSTSPGMWLSPAPLSAGGAHSQDATLLDSCGSAARSPDPVWSTAFRSASQRELAWQLRKSSARHLFGQRSDNEVASNSLLLHADDPVSYRQEDDAHRGPDSTGHSLDQTSIQSSSAPSGSAANAAVVAATSLAQPPWRTPMALTRTLSAMLAPVRDLFSPFPAAFTSSSVSGDMSRWVPMQRVLLVHPDLEQSRSHPQLLSQRSAPPGPAYTPIPAMLFGGALSTAHHGYLALLLADVAERTRTTSDENEILRREQLTHLRRRLLALKREPLCGAVTAQEMMAEEDAIAHEYRRLCVLPTTAAAAAGVVRRTLNRVRSRLPCLCLLSVSTVYAARKNF